MSVEPWELRQVAAQEGCPPGAQAVLRAAADEIVTLRRRLVFLERAQDGLCRVIEEQGQAVELLREASGYVADADPDAPLLADIDRVLAAVDRPHEDENNNNSEGGQQ